MYKANKKSKNLTNRNKKTAKKCVPPLKEWNAIFAKVFQSGEKQENDVFEGIQNKTDDSEWQW